MIPYTKPSITELEISYATDAVANGWGPACYEYINKFENSMAKFLGTKHAVATSSCTGSIHLGLAAAGIGKGDEVILADTNWIATVAPIVHLGAIPIFVDVYQDSWTLDVDLVREAITTKTKAIVVTHLYGNLAELDLLREISDSYKILLIEDAAEALGSMYKGRMAGTVGDFGVFSFHGTKMLTTGEGGLLVTNDDVIAQSVRDLNNHGRTSKQKKQFWPEMVGYKFKMSNVQAAIGLGQSERLPELIARKREIFGCYRDQFEPISHLIKMNPESEGNLNSYWMPTIVTSKESRVSSADLINNLQSSGIDARVFFSPLSSLPMFTQKESNVIAYALPNYALNLPSFHDITHEEIEYVAKVVLDSFNEL
jgi:perosamine synthetase